jgi:hypothetical protein
LIVNRGLLFEKSVSFQPTSSLFLILKSDPERAIGLREKHL